MREEYIYIYRLVGKLFDVLYCDCHVQIKRVHIYVNINGRLNALPTV